MTGASWDVQLVAALTAAGFGALAALPTLPCALKLRALERFATDFVAAATVGIMFLLSVETGSEGQPTFYCAVIYMLSLCFSRRLLLRPFEKLAEKSAAFRAAHAKTKAEKRPISPPQDDLPAPSSSQDNPPRAERRIFAFPRAKGGSSVRRRQADVSD